MVVVGATVAHARPASTGFFAEGGLDVVKYLSPGAASAAAGPGLALRVGRDLFSWLSIGGYLAGSTHEATVPPPPDGQFFQLYRAGADGRLSIPAGPMAIFAEGGFGASMISSNVLEKVLITKPGKSFSATIHAGGGLEYQLENRHYAIGLAADWFVEPQFRSMKGIETRLYLRYTYGGG
jgi:hypothetical protein